jgi:multiple sugar transport system substrate-binding protein
VNLPFTKFSTNERKQLLTRSFRNKTTRVDVFAVDLVWVPRFAKWAEPISSYFTQSERDRFLPHALESCYFDNALVGVPFYIDIGLMYYRADLVRKLPHSSEIEQALQRSMSWEDFVELGRRPELAAYPFYLFPADNYEGLICSFVEAIGPNQASFRGVEQLDLNTPQTVRALKMLVGLVNKYRLTPRAVTEYKEADVYQHALVHDAVFFRGWPGNLRTYASQYPEKISNIGMAALPHFRDDRPASIFGGWNLMISRQSERKNEALEFLRFVTSKDMQQMLYQEGGYLPSNRSVYEDAAFVAANPELRYLHSLLEHGVHRPALVEYTKISDILSSYIKRAIKGEIPAEAALQGAQEMIQSHKVLIN